MTTEHSILVVEDSRGWREFISETLEDHGYKVIQADSIKQAKSELKKQKFSLVTVDLNYTVELDPGDGEIVVDKGSNLLEHIKKMYPGLPCIVITSSEKRGREAVMFGFKFGDIVKDFLEKSDDQIAVHLPKQIESIIADFDNTPDQAITQQSTSEANKKVFVSYAWGGESEKIVDQLDESFQINGITIIRDKRVLGYKGQIQEFMEQIGRGKAVIVVISDKYLTSPNCMFELVQIAKNGQVYDRIFPIVLADAKIYRPVERIKYVQHWEQEIKELDEAMKSVSAANMQGFRDEIDQYTEIRNTVAELAFLLKDMNTLTPEMHSESGFETLFKTIVEKLDND